MLTFLLRNLQCSPYKSPQNLVYMNFKALIETFFRLIKSDKQQKGPFCSNLSELTKKKKGEQQIPL